MANKILNLIFKADATDATAEMKKLQGTPGGDEGGGTGILGVTSSLRATIQPAMALGAAVLGIGAALKFHLDSYTAYVTEVDKLSSSLQVTVEDASFLMSIMERYGVTNDTMVAIFRKMATEGIDPTVEGLQDLLIEWENLAGLDQAQFATSMFGEQGVKEILPLWVELRAVGLDLLDGQQTGLEVTVDMVEETRELKTVTATVGTEWDTLKGQLTEGVIPTLITIGQYIFIAMEYSRRMKEYLTGIGSGGSAAIRPAPGGGIVTGFGQQTTLPEPERVDPRGNRPGGTDEAGLSELRRLVDGLPVAIADAVERR